MAENVLKVEVREGTGKGVARKLRAAGRIPGILYGRAKDSVPVSLDPRVLERAIQKSEAGVNTLFDLELEGGAKAGARVVLVKELQREPAAGFLLHADLYEVDLAQTVEVEVPIRLLGTPPGVALEGGIMDHIHRELRLECLPRAIPDSIEVDVSALELGDSIHVRDLALPAEARVLSDPELPVASVVSPKAEEEETPAAEEELAEGETPAEEGAEEADKGDESSE